MKRNFEFKFSQSEERCVQLEVSFRFQFQFQIEKCFSVCRREIEDKNLCDVITEHTPLNYSVVLVMPE